MLFTPARSSERTRMAGSLTRAFISNASYVLGVMSVDDATLRQALAENEVETEYVAITSDMVYVGYQTQRNETSRLFNELRTVASVTLETCETPKPIEATLFHTERPILARWTVERDWAEDRTSGQMSNAEFGARILQTLDPLQFQ